MFIVQQIDKYNKECTYKCNHTALEHSLLKKTGDF